MNRQIGFTLIEMMVTISILAIIVSLAAPSFNEMIKRQRLSGAAEGMYTDLQLARSEAIKRNTTIGLAVTTNGSTTWCYAISDTLPCNCNTAGACKVNNVASRVVSSDNYNGVALASSRVDNTITFSSPRGTAASGTYSFTIDNQTYRVVVDALGFPDIQK
jgi:prepilin-type N-terminal cleavage/methylation domain-containing protein